MNIYNLCLYKLLANKDTEFLAKLRKEYFSGIHLVIYNRIQEYYTINLEVPSIDQFKLLKKSDAVESYCKDYIYEHEEVDLINGFILDQLQEQWTKDKTVDFLSNFLDNFDGYYKDEIIEELDNHVLHLSNSGLKDSTTYDISELDFISEEQSFTVKPSGLSSLYDRNNGGFALQELVMLGGRRGSGKSIISLNLTLERFLQGDTVAFLSIEMRYKEVHDRLMSIISRVPFLDIFKNTLTIDQKVKIALAKTNLLYDTSSDHVNDILGQLKETKDILKFKDRVKNEAPPLKDNRFFLIDDEGLTGAGIDTHCTLFNHKYPRFTMATVDYLNIIKSDDRMDWKTQIILADKLKNISRKHDLTVLSPYQIDATGEARFAKGILDSADRSFIFFPAEIDAETNKSSNKLEIHTSKIRNGEHMNFDIYMDWPCVRIDKGYNSNELSSRPHSGVMYGGKDGEAIDL